MNRILNTGEVLPPQAVDVEEVVIGSVMMEKEAYLAIADRFFPELFYLEKNQLIAKTIMTLVNEGTPVDVVTVVQELRKTGNLEKVGGAYHISKLTERIASAINIETHILHLWEHFVKREVIIMSTNSIKNAYDVTTDALDVLDNLEKHLTKIVAGLYIQKALDIQAMFAQVIEHNNILTSKPGAIAGVTTGFSALDRATGGWHKQSMIVLAARPGMGKTALVIRSGVLAAIAGTPVAIFSLEQPALQLMQRILSQETQIPLEKFVNTGMDADTLATLRRTSDRIFGGGKMNLPLFIDDSGGITIAELKRKARKLKREKHIGLIIIDYLQLMSDGESKNREQEVSKISRNIKALAKELDIPIIALSQLSRETENRPGADKRPKLTDLRESGSIEQDADMVMFIYRPEYYGLTVDEHNESTFGKAEILIAKNRHGAIGVVKLKFQSISTLFYDPEDELVREALSDLQPNSNFINDRQLPKENDDFEF